MVRGWIFFLRNILRYKVDLWSNCILVDPIFHHQVAVAILVFLILIILSVTKIFTVFLRVMSTKS